MSKRRRSRIYVKCGRYYGDFRDLGGKLEALIPNGAARGRDRATGARRADVLRRVPRHNPAPVTRQIVDAGRLLDVPCYDHVILAGERYVSFAEASLL